MCTFILKGQRSWVCLGAGSCLQPGSQVWAPSTACRPSSQGLTQEERAGMRKWLKAQIYTLCHLPEATTSPPLCLIWVAQQCWACNLWTIISPSVAFMREKKRGREKRWTKRLWFLELLEWHLIMSDPMPLSPLFSHRIKQSESFSQSCHI